MAVVEFQPVLEAGVAVGEWVVYDPWAGWWEGGSCFSAVRCHARRFWSEAEAREAWEKHFAVAGSPRARR
jgi:hypothetical protein